MHIEAINISCYRADKYLFRNLNFKVRPGELMHIQGQNGAGKSTLLKIVAGLSTPDKGKILWANKPIAEGEAFKEQMAYISHRMGINLALTVKENLKLLLGLAQVSLCSSSVATVMEKFGLKTKENTPCYKLSQGQQRKVALCGLLLKNKKLWLLDEPTTSLDAASVEVFNHCLQTHLEANGAAVMVSHHPLHMQAHQVLSL